MHRVTARSERDAKASGRAGGRPTGAAIAGAVLFVALTSPAFAATVTLLAAPFSASRPVAHLLLEGEIVSGDLDRLAAGLRQAGPCEPAALPDTGGNCAVVTLAGENGDSIEGLRIAQFFRDHAVATWLSAGTRCRDACALAFLGGSGFATGAGTSAGMGDYRDRTLEPGASLILTAPGVDLGGGELGPRALARLASGEALSIDTAQDLALLGISLPDLPLRLWQADAEEALRNACLWLLARHTGLAPGVLSPHLPEDIETDLGIDDRGWALSGYRPDRPELPLCALHHSDAALNGNADIALYRVGTEGIFEPILTFFHRPDGWSELRLADDPMRHHPHRGPISAVFLSPDTVLDEEPARIWQRVGPQFLATGDVGP